MLYPPLLLVGSVTLTVTRTTASTYVNGRLVAGTPTTVSVVANVQPVMKSSDTLVLQEADRSKAVLKVYTKGDELRQLKEGANGWSADRFEWKGDTYEVMKVIEYDTGNQLKHFKALCSRVELT
jgi:hypothetical protein